MRSNCPPPVKLSPSLSYFSCKISLDFATVLVLQLKPHSIEYGRTRCRPGPNAQHKQNNRAPSVEIEAKHSNNLQNRNAQGPQGFQKRPSFQDRPGSKNPNHYPPSPLEFPDHPNPPNQQPLGPPRPPRPPNSAPAALDLFLAHHP